MTATIFKKEKANYEYIKQMCLLIYHLEPKLSSYVVQTILANTMYECAVEHFTFTR